MASYFLDKIEIIRSQVIAQQQSISTVTQPTPVLFPLKKSCLVELSPVSFEELMKCIRQSNNRAYDLDSCSTVLLKESFPVHLAIVLHMFSSSLQHAVCPECFKVADVTLQCLIRLTIKPRTALSSYRPISNLPYLTSVLERIVVHRLQTFLERCGLTETFSRLSIGDTVSAARAMKSNFKSVLHVFHSRCLSCCCSFQH